MKKTFLTILITFLCIASFGQSRFQRAKHYNLEGKLGLQGYDPVAYFKQNDAVKGKVGLAETSEGVIYYFSSQANREAFAKNPEAYEPQYGGWCAYAMGDSGEKVEIDPQTFKIIDGKLYLYYNAFFNNTLKTWNKSEAALKKKADANWKKIMQ